MLRALRDGSWLDRRRLRNYPAIFLGLWLTAAVVLVALSDGVMDPLGRPLGSDFVTFWASSKLLLSGQPLAVYDDAALFAAEQAAAGGALAGHFAMLYPPPGLLLIMPLALLPYLQSLALWLGVTFAAYLLVLWLAWPNPWVVFLALAAPASFVVVGHGQNAFLSGGLLGGAMLLLPRHQIAAGILIGLMVYKPHLGLVVPLALIAGGQWRAFVSAAATATVVGLATVVVLGWQTWPAFLGRLEFAGRILDEGLIPWFKLQSTYTALRLLGADGALASAAQWTVAGLAVAATAWLWWRSDNHRLKTAALMTAALLATPFVYDYDFALLGLPLVLLAREGADGGFLPWEKTILAAVWTAPLVLRGIGQWTHVGLGPLVLLLLMGLILRRTLHRA